MLKNPLRRNFMLSGITFEYNIIMNNNTQQYTAIISVKIHLNKETKVETATISKSSLFKSI